MGGPTARVLELLSLLQTHRFWSGPELSSRLGVSERTLRRDIDRLRSLGYPVDATPGVAGGYRLEAGAHVPPLQLDDDEAVAIAVGLHSAAVASVAGIEETALRALTKLEQVLPDRLRRRVAALHSQVDPLRWGGNEDRVDPEVLSVLAQGCRDGEEIRFDYRRRDGEDSRRLVEPHRMVSSGRRWYLVAWDVRAGDWRTFRLDRMSAAALAGRRFTPRPVPGGDAAQFVAASIRSMPTKHSARVTVDAPADELAEVARWIGGGVEPLADGRCVVSLGADELGWLAANVAVLALRHPIEIEGPERLRETLVQLGANLGALTSGPGDPSDA